MKILYRCEYCGGTHNSETCAHKCEVAHEEWLNAEIEVKDNDFSCGMDGTPYKIRLRNKSGKSYLYMRCPI